MTAGKASEALAPTGGDPSRYLPALITESGLPIAEVIAQNLGGQQIGPQDFERVKVPAGGGLFWTIATPENPKGAASDVFRGVIVHHRPARTYWKEPFGSGEKVPPDCFSDDGVVGIGTPGGQCGTPAKKGQPKGSTGACPYNEFDSDPKGGPGKACAERRLVFVVSPDSFLPRVLVVPAMSLGNMRNYFVELSRVGKAFWSVQTEFRLTKAKSSGNVDYGQIVATLGKTLSREEIDAVQRYAAELRPIFAQVRVEQSDVEDAA